MKKFLKKRSKGFTLVELLIVIIIIGILAGMMMLSTGGATAKAEATKIVSDARNIKAAAIMYYADHGDWSDKIGDLADYLDGKIASADEEKELGKGKFKLESGDKYFVAVEVKDSDIKKALENMEEAGDLSGDVFRMRIK